MKCVKETALESHMGLNYSNNIHKAFQVIHSEIQNSEFRKAVNLNASQKRIIKISKHINLGAGISIFAVSNCC